MTISKMQWSWFGGQSDQCYYWVILPNQGKVFLYSVGGCCWLHEFNFKEKGGYFDKMQNMGENRSFVLHLGGGLELEVLQVNLTTTDIKKFLAENFTLPPQSGESEPIRSPAEIPDKPELIRSICLKQNDGSCISGSKIIGHVGLYSVSEGHEAADKWAEAFNVETCESLVEVGRLAVHREFRGKGYGKLLSREATIEALRMKRNVVAAVAVGNAASLKAIYSSGMVKIADLYDPARIAHSYFALPYRHTNVES